MNCQNPMLNNVIYIYSFTTCLPVLSQDLHPSVMTLTSHTFVHLLRIPVLFFLLFPPFTLPPQPHTPYPPSSVLPHNFIWKTSYMVTRACQLSAAPGMTDELMDGAGWAGQQGASVGRWTARSSLARARECIKNLPGEVGTRTKTRESWRPLNRHSNPPMAKCF